VRQVNTKAWRQALKRVGIEDFRWHDLRLTWASWHVQAGTPLPVLQELGGWQVLETVLKYAHLGQRSSRAVRRPHVRLAARERWGRGYVFCYRHQM